MYSSSTSSPYYGMPVARQADGPYGAPVPVRPVSRASSHTPTPMPVPVRPLSRAPSPAPPGMIRSTDIIRGSGGSGDFQIEKAPKSPGPYGRPSLPQQDGYNNRNEQMFRQQVTALIAATGQQIVASGRVPAGSNPLVLFFRTKVGPFPPARIIAIRYLIRDHSSMLLCDRMGSRTVLIFQSIRDIPTLHL